MGMPFSKILKTAGRTGEGFIYSDLMMRPTTIHKASAPDVAFSRFRDLMYHEVQAATLANEYTGGFGAVKI